MFKVPVHRSSHLSWLIPTYLAILQWLWRVQMVTSSSSWCISVLQPGFYFIFHHIWLRKSPSREQCFHQFSVSNSSIYCPNLATNNRFPVPLQACYHWLSSQHLESITVLLHQIFRFIPCLFHIPRHSQWDILIISVYSSILHWFPLHDPTHQWLYMFFSTNQRDKWHSTLQSRFLLMNYIFIPPESRNHRFFHLFWFPSSHQHDPMACCRYTVICEHNYLSYWVRPRQKLPFCLHETPLLSDQKH